MVRRCPIELALEPHGPDLPRPDQPIAAWIQRGSPWRTCAKRRRTTAREERGSARGAGDRIGLHGAYSVPNASLLRGLWIVAKHLDEAESASDAVIHVAARSSFADAAPAHVGNETLLAELKARRSAHPARER